MRWDYYNYVPVSEKKEAARKQLEKLLKKNPSMQPVIIEGRTIAKTFWGMAWNKNLESYADYTNRIGRGRSYVKNGMVLDLYIEEGRIGGLVAGSRKTPYRVEIKIAPLAKDRWRAISEVCGRRIGGVEELIEGKFPRAYAEVFLKQGTGLFPSPKDIRMSCSCPDWATLCKHAAAVLYAVGARLDVDPLLFFKLRGIGFGELVAKSAGEKMESMLKNAGRRTRRVIDDADVAGIFGV